MTSVDHQGGKRFGQLKKQQEQTLDEINQSFKNSGDYDDEEDYPDLDGKLESYKKQFMEFDLDNSGDIDIMELKKMMPEKNAELKKMMEKLGQAKTHLELKKMIAEVDTTNSGTISYNEFLTMMLGKKSSVLKLILLFEEKKKEKEKPKGVAPKRDLSSLP
ncbi:allograft inflammatory factor 1-like isoform X1 [Actinia tenebrosa]|uniref:Allograft inflammatory factor 1-like isoform X1 n=1 Tax=Actinia tenebrosa TaxID=6105 RepID=A0A6P8I5U8_ACTTE|nr:allograft inflammatory factor 1-like isoform X1 [Actinia tenebrosa]